MGSQNIGQDYSAREIDYRNDTLRQVPEGEEKCNQESQSVSRNKKGKCSIRRIIVMFQGKHAR